MKLMKMNKCGSSAVFLTLILAALMTVTLTLVYSIREITASNIADEIIELACDSVMSEFDHKVQKEYGLFLIKGTDKELAARINSYIDYSFDDMDNVKKEKVKVTASRYPVSDIDLVKDQILEHVKYMEIHNVFKKMQQSDGKSINNMTERKLQHGPTITSLPSAQIPEKSLTALAESIGDRTDEFSDVFKEGSEKYMINRYILTCFNSKSNAVNEEHFFKNEIEYILGGKLTDKKNERKIKIALEALRFPANLAHIYQDPKKKAAVIAAAEVLTPGAGTATQLALASTWAYAESDNDVKLLWQGHKVPAVKDEATWAVDLDSAVEGLTEGIMTPDIEKGYTYSQYLQILLFFQDENIKITRILDLIQINMRKNCDRRFLIQEYSAGIAASVGVNGRTYSYEKKY